jgi:hypothetical protein
VIRGNADEAVKLLIADYQKPADVILQDEAIFPELLKGARLGGD